METIPFVREKSAAIRSQKIDADAKTVRVQCTTQTKAGTVQCDWTLDFSKVPMSKLLELAKRSVIIDLQRPMRDMERADLVGQYSGTVDVNTLGGRGGPRVVSKEAIKTAFTGMNEEQRKALMAELEAMGKKA